MKTQRLPNFIIAGAPRSGTTWIHNLLDRHPEIYMAKPVFPEPKFFLIDELFNRGITYYSRTWFANISENILCGEKSTNYLENSLTAWRIRKTLPNAKLIFILREPAERAFSNYKWSKMNGHECEFFETALILENQREFETSDKLRYVRPYAYFSRGLYADLLRPFFNLFPRKQILCLRYEDIIDQPEKLAVNLHYFLGLTIRSDDAYNLGVINPSKNDTREMPEHIRQYLTNLYCEPNKKLAKLLGSTFPIWGK